MSIVTLTNTQSTKWAPVKLLPLKFVPTKSVSWNVHDTNEQYFKCAPLNDTPLNKDLLKLVWYDLVFSKSLNINWLPTRLELL